LAMVKAQPWRGTGANGLAWLRENSGVQLQEGSGCPMTFLAWVRVVNVTRRGVALCFHELILCEFS
jgi:hypothetical protein